MPAANVALPALAVAVEDRQAVALAAVAAEVGEAAVVVVAGEQFSNVEVIQ